MIGSVTPDRVLKELANLWVTLGGHSEKEGGAGVLRACSMTLVVLSEENEETGSLGETIAALMPEHPARTILIRLREGGERTLTDRVYAQCWMPFGQRRQICCEQIEITASDAALGDLASVVLPLVAPDMPVLVWCRSARLLGMPEFRAIAGMATKVVVDSAGRSDPQDAMRRMSDAVGRGVILGDLAWTRLTRWREMLSQVFENRQHLEQLARVSQARVTYGKGFETEGRYLAAWIGNALPQAKLSLAADGPSSIRVELEGTDLHVELSRQGDRLVVTVNYWSQCTNLSQPTDYLLMREELSIVRHDPIFEKALSTAAQS